MKKILIKLFFLTLGCFIAAYALETFLVPNNIIDGGVVGVSIMSSYLTGIDLGFFVVVLNIPFILLAYKKMGLRFVIYTLYSVITLAFFIHVCETYFDLVTKDLFLSSIFGGIVLGIGVGTVLKNGASLDGTEILAIRFNKKVPFTVGEIIMFFNIFIFICAGFVYEPDRAMYSAITYFTAYKCIDMVIQGLNESKSIFIVSDKHEELAKRIMEEICRGVTYVKAQGGYSLSDKKMIFCVISRFEISKLKEIINDVDPEAFMAIENVHEVTGRQYNSQNKTPIERQST